MDSSIKDLHIDFGEDGDKFTVKFSGRMNVQDGVNAYSNIFDKITDKFSGMQISIIDLDFSSLEFCNSSGIRSISKFFQTLSKIADKEKFKISLKYSKDIFWHSTSLAPLAKVYAGIIINENG